MSTPAKAGGYIDRDLLDRAIRANQEMTQIILQVSQGNLPPAMSLPLMRFAALLAGQLGHLRDMQTIRRENGNA
jgi:hypothetical protein